ncbi:hypothetical protein, partial [Prevotellamassilia timonensis]|uniref:hypothetical protein n=1 Tax=Prevotellamassilia timonensis TaxID=1852370 RepID=UPI004024D30B
MPDYTLAANACAAVCTLLVLGVALTCCVRWPFGFGGSDLSVTGERFPVMGERFHLLVEIYYIDAVCFLKILRSGIIVCSGVVLCI